MSTLTKLPMTKPRAMNKTICAKLMESDVNQQIGNLSTLLEPVIMVVLGTLIGGILLALYLPIFNLGQVF